MIRTRIQVVYSELLPCIGDTDGDGNCPLPLCGHCHPENFTEYQLKRMVLAQGRLPTTEELAEALFVAAVTPPIASPLVGLTEKLARDVWRQLSAEAQDDQTKAAIRIIELLGATDA